MLRYSMHTGPFLRIEKFTRGTHGTTVGFGLLPHRSKCAGGLPKGFGLLSVLQRRVGQGLQMIGSNQPKVSTRGLGFCPARSLHISACAKSSQLQLALPQQSQWGREGSDQRTKNPWPSRKLPPYRKGKGKQVAFWPQQDFPHVASRPTLSQEQEYVLKKVVKDKKSVFFTGSAGTGKSVLLRAIIRALGGPSDEVVVTASTGIAAVNIGGQTLHSFAGAGLGNAPIEKLHKRVRWASRARWRRVKVLVIDEISMVDATWFDCLEEIARRARGKKEPFGGIQLVICGDFFQLPPVPDREVTDAPASFVFDSWTWERCIQEKIMLTQVFRQKDPKLVKMLNDARVGVVSPESAKTLQSLARPVEYEDGIGPTEIYPLRSQADWANARKLSALPGELFCYPAEDIHGENKSGERVQPDRVAHLLGRMVVPLDLKLKIGAQVMCLRNVRGVGVVNGSTGRVVDFMNPSDFRSEIEIHPGWKIISSLEPSEKNEDGFVSRQPLVSRPVLKVQHSKARKEAYDNTKWPVVQFPNGIRALMGPVSFTYENKQNEVEIERMQVPLMLSWAMTVHKSQGQTLDRVKIDLERTFERGQAYVALSRCTSLEGLEVYNFSEAAVVANPRVQEWSRELQTLNRMVFGPLTSRRKEST